LHCPGHAALDALEGAWKIISGTTITFESIYEYLKSTRLFSNITYLFGTAFDSIFQMWKGGMCFVAFLCTEGLRLSPKTARLTFFSSPATRHGDAWGRGGIVPTHSWPRPQMGGGGGQWSESRPGRALPRGKNPRYSLYRRLGGSQSRSGHRC
jgi:hypothetical protein